MKRYKWWIATSSVVLGALIVLVFLVAVPQRGLASGLIAPSVPDFEVSPGYGLDVDLGTIAEYTHIITNTGTVDAYFGLQATASEGWPVDYANELYPGGTTMLLPFPLQAGEAATVSVLLTVPAGVTGGTVNTTAVTVSMIIDSAVYANVVEYDVATVKMHYVYLPVVFRDYHPFVNGDFSEGLAFWERAGTLGTSLAFDPNAAGNVVAVLGDPGHPCYDLPIGFGGISQYFPVPLAPSGKTVHLQFRYRIYTNDRNRYLVDTYDYFDVYVKGVRKFRDANRNPDYFDYCNVAPYDLGWRTGEVDLGTGAEYITLAFEVHSTDEWYNTYVYVDDVEMVFVD